MTLIVLVFVFLAGLYTIMADTCYIINSTMRAPPGTNYPDCYFPFCRTDAVRVSGHLFAEFFSATCATYSTIPTLIPGTGATSFTRKDDCPFQADTCYIINSTMRAPPGTNYPDCYFPFCRTDAVRVSGHLFAEFFSATCATYSTIPTLIPGTGATSFTRKDDCPFQG